MLDLVYPHLDLGCLVRILFARELDARLQLAKRNGRQMEILVGNSLKPSDHGSVGPLTPQFRDYVRVEKIHGRSLGHRR